VSVAETAPARQGPPWLFLIAAILIGVGLAVGAGALLSSNQTATASPTPGSSATAIASGDLPSTLPSPSIAPASEPPLVTAAPTTTPTAAPTTKPTPTPNTNPKIVSWTVPTYEDCTNGTAGSVHVSWSIARATGVTISIDGPGIYDSYQGTSGSIDLPYGCDIAVLQHTYTLKTTGGTGPTASSTKTIKTRPAEILKFTMPNEVSCTGKSGSIEVPLVYEIRAATSAHLYGFATNGDLVVEGVYTGKTSNNDTILYACFWDKITYHLVTEGGYGAVDEDIENVTRVLSP
jgi:hypothetical protein